MRRRSFMENNAYKYEIKKILWDRIWISFFIDDIPDKYIVFLKKISRYPVHKKNSSDRDVIFPLKIGTSGEYKLNISNPGNCKMLSAGIYQLIVMPKEYSVSDNSSSEIEILGSAVNIPLKYYNRQFIYFHKERAYRVQFSDKHGFLIKISDTRLENLTFSNRLISDLRTFRNNSAKSILRAIYNVEYLLFHYKGKKEAAQLSNPKILLMSDMSEEMGSNMSALKNALLREGYAPKECLRAVTTRHYNLLHWIKSLKKMAEADFIFLDDHSQTTDWLTLKGTVLTQLWHAGAGFKSTGYSRFGMPASPAPFSGHRQYTYGIAGSKKIRHFFSEVWGINDEMVLPTGMPRLDLFLNRKHYIETRKKLQKDYPFLQNNKRIILFAPTYRGENRRTAYYPYDRLDMDKLYKMCLDTNSFIIYKMHPFVKEPVPIPKEYMDRMADLTDYSDINDLFYITDLLITDYSSNIYEFSLMRKPMLFYAFDIDDYVHTRGFHRDFDKNAPGRIVESFQDMLDAIYNTDFEYEKVEKYISENFESVDCHACDRIIDWIIRGNMPEDI